ncbi:MAG: L,D-transpeptidase family protein, partial [Candidatus Binatia bacterium]
MVLFVIALLPAAARGADGSVRLIVWKKLRLLQVVRGEKVLRTYRVSLGVSPNGTKEIRGDGRTPVGIYRVTEKRDSGRFHKFLGLSYPDSTDADRAFDAGRIDADTWADIYLASKRGEHPPWNTALGGYVGIHGTGSGGRKAEL